MWHHFLCLLNMLGWTTFLHHFSNFSTPGWWPVLWLSYWWILCLRSYKMNNYDEVLSSYTKVTQKYTHTVSTCNCRIFTLLKKAQTSGEGWTYSRTGASALKIRKTNSSKQKKKHSVQNVKFNIPKRAVGVYHNNRSMSVMYVPQVLVSTNVLQHKFFFEST